MAQPIVELQSLAEVFFGPWTRHVAIGCHALDRQRSLRIPDMFAAIFTLGILGFITKCAFLKIEQHFLRWRSAGVETS